MDCSSNPNEPLLFPYKFCISVSLASRSFCSSLIPVATIHFHSLTASGKSFDNTWIFPTGAMGRDGAAAWTDPSGNSPSLGQTASRVDDMAWPDSNDLYIVDPDSLDHPADSKIDRSLQNPTQLPSPPPVEVPHWTVGTQNSPRAWGSNAFELIANAAMSRQSSQGGNINPPQYQLTSSESPADQAKSMSQVSPGFIFVIFPLSRACF